MYGNAGAYNAYNQNNIQVESPYKLIEMMYEGILRFSMQAKKSIRENNVEKKIYWINRITNIFIELLNSLDMDAGGDISHYLNGLYSYQLQTLSEANIENNEEKIDGVIKVVKGLLEAWRETTKNEMD